MADRSSRARLDALLVKRAVEPLTETETVELRALLERHTEYDADAMDRAAAAVYLAVTAAGGGMPAHLRTAIESVARRALGAGKS